MTRTLAAAMAALALAGAAEARRFPVGVATLPLTKTSVTSGAPRALETVVWYPALRRGGTPEAFGLRDATPRRGRFPLIVFSHGSCGLPTEASYLTTALAAAGFVVAAPPHPGNTATDFPGCLSVAAFVDSAVNRQPDVTFVIDAMLAETTRGGARFARRIDVDRIGVAGLSFGGFTALRTAQLDARVDAALALVPGGSGALGPEPLALPVMVIGAERDLVVGFRESELVYERLTGPRFLIELLGANHLSAVDSCAEGLAGGDFCVPQDIPQDEAHRLIVRYALPFARRYVAGRRGAGRGLARAVDGVVLTGER